MLKESTLTITPDDFDSMSTDYHWMVNAIKEMRSEMVIGARTAQYGIEATKPKAVGGVGIRLYKRLLDVQKTSSVLQSMRRSY